MISGSPPARRSTPIAAGLIVSLFDLGVPAAIGDPLATIGTATPGS